MKASLYERHSMLDYNLPGASIFISLWALFSLSGLHLSPQSSLFGAVVAGFIVAAILCIPAALVLGIIARLFT